MSKIGKTWWGQQWLNSLNNIDYSNRLPRGASYANKGAVEKLKITKNQIHAKVIGSRPRPYNVDIILPPFFDPELSLFIEKLAAKPTIIARLLNRELDSQVLSIAEETGLKVFPRQWTDFKMQCSCPDWAVPCKHLAAVIYKMCAEIDNNPFLVFELHNVDLITELGKRNIIVNKETTEVPRLYELFFEKKTENSKKFNTEEAYQKLHFAKLSPIHEPLLALLSPMPVFYTQASDFKEKYEAKLKRAVKNAEKVLKGKVSLQNLLSDKMRDESAPQKRLENIVVIDSDYKARIAINEANFSLPHFLQQLAQIPPQHLYDYQPSTAALNTVMQFSIHLLANGAVVPQVVQWPDKRYSVRWLPALLSKQVQELIHDLEKIIPPGIFVWQNNKSSKIINHNTGFHLVSVVLTELIGLLNDEKEDDIFLKLFFQKYVYPFTKPGEEALCGGIMAWLQKYFITQGNYKTMLLVEELANEKFRIKVQVDDTKKALKEPVPLKDILQKNEYDNDRFEILQSVTQLSNFIKGLDEYIDSKGEAEIVHSNELFTNFLMEMVPVIQLLDIDVLLPKSLQQILKPKPSVKLKRVKDGSKSFIKLQDLLSFDWRVAIGDTLMSEEEFRKIAAKSNQLIKIKSSYVYVSAQDMEKLYRHYTQSKELSSMDLLRVALSEEYEGAAIEMSDDIKDIIRELTDYKNITLPLGLKATLRPYQQRGFSWMYKNARIGFGSVLADDMGLGKTLQVITTLLKYKEEGLLEDEKILVVAPTGLLTNWQAEIEKFAPSLQSKIYHGTQRKFHKKDKYDVAITSYGIARSDAAGLKKMKWHTLVIDEAQNIKNIKTAQTRAIKSIGAKNFIAMSGTPVENRLSELWSIFDYSNRGFLGNDKYFAEEYGVPIQQYNDEAAAEKLKKVTGPFMMRRLKTDKSIIRDLPDKLEMDAYATLTGAQTALYEEALEKAMKDIEAVEGTDNRALFVRQGLVLQMMLALKQICNHPTQFLKNAKYDATLSGKTELLFDRLDSIVESDEKVLLFTQFTEMGKLLERFIKERYSEAPLYYHGGINIKKRKEMVERFQTNHADKIFILSLKAAGTGLNLTQANHVIHYDLWWNPAVENQATDRAFRIGQTKNVMVHRFITKGTFEERINEMIQSKKALANMTVATGENWIGQLSNNELRKLFGRG